MSDAPGVLTTIAITLLVGFAVFITVRDSEGDGLMILLATTLGVVWVIYLVSYIGGML